MPNPFAITTATNTVSLNNNQQGQVPFLVSNTTGQSLRGRAHVVALSTTAESWLTLVGETERDFAAHGSQQYVVQITVPASAPAGDYTLRLDAVDVANPDDNFSEGPAVKFMVAAPVPQKKPFPWWIVAVAVGALLVVGGGIYGLVRVLNPPPSYCLQANTQSLTITGIETGTNPSAQHVTLSNCGSAGSWTGTAKTNSGGAWLNIGTSTGSLTTGAKQDIAVTTTTSSTNGNGGSSPLKAGTYTGTLTFTLGGHIVSVVVTFNVQPALSVNPPNVPLQLSVLANNSDSTLIHLTNYSTAGTVSAEVSVDTGYQWLQVKLQTGTPIANKQTLDIHVFYSVGNLGIGTYMGSIKLTVKTSAGTVSVIVPVQLTVSP